MNPYESPSDAPVATSVSFSTELPPNLRVVSAAIGALTSTLALFGWTFAIIYHIDTTFTPNMGFWAFILFVIAMFSAPLVAFAVYRCSYYCSSRVRVVPYAIAACVLGCVVLFTIPAIALVQALPHSLLLSYGMLTGLMVFPTCLLGFAVSGLIVWLGSAHQMRRRTSEDT